MVFHARVIFFQIHFVLSWSWHNTVKYVLTEVTKTCEWFLIGYFSSRLLRELVSWVQHLVNTFWQFYLLKQCFGWKKCGHVFSTFNDSVHLWFAFTACFKRHLSHVLKWILGMCILGGRCDYPLLILLINFPLEVIECIQYQRVLRGDWRDLNSWMWAHCSCAKCSACCCSCTELLWMEPSSQLGVCLAGWYVCRLIAMTRPASVGDSFCYASCWLSEKWLSGICGWRSTLPPPSRS